MIDLWLTTINTINLQIYLYIRTCIGDKDKKFGLTKNFHREEDDIFMCVSQKYLLK